LNDKSVRNLAHLQHTASTARVLNLLRISKKRSDEPDYLTHPFFRNVVLNKSIILKHRLRRDELELFTDGRQTATKVIIPIDGGDLKLGGRAVFVDQIGYDAQMEAMFGDTWVAETDDQMMLELLDQLPSLDPFLLREHLKRHSRFPARCYFDVSEADVARMIRFVEGEIQKLIDLAFSGGDRRREGSGSRLVKKILSISVDEDTEPLRLTLRLDKRDYQEGVFCWKGFLYYKWTLNETLPNIERVMNSIGLARPRGPIDTDAKLYLEKARDSLRRSISMICETAQGSLAFYDRAFDSLIDGHPQAFRDFLLGAPAMFTDLGERLGAVNHIVSFWNFRFPQGRLPVVGVEELMDIFNDFECSLSFQEARGGYVRMA
jgi:hypothetical protein